MRLLVGLDVVAPGRYGRGATGPESPDKAYHLSLEERGFRQTDVSVPIRPSALVCSTLYADAHNRVTRHLLGESNGLCVPAYLSQAQELIEVETDWLKLARRSALGQMVRVRAIVGASAFQ